VTQYVNQTMCRYILDMNNGNRYGIS